MTQTTRLRKPFVKALAILSALMLSLAACGDEGGDENTTTPSASTESVASPEASTETSEQPSTDGSEQPSTDGNESPDSNPGVDNNAGAENGETEVVLNAVQNGVYMTFTYYAVGDEVTRQTTRNVMP